MTNINGTAERKPDNNTTISGVFKTKRMLVFGIMIITLIVILIISLYLRYEWEKYQDLASLEAIQLVESAESLLHPEHIRKLSGDTQDLLASEYISSKESLERFVEATKIIKFAYILQEKNGNLIFILDSAPVDSIDSSPPGQIFREAHDYIWEPFKTGKTVITPPTSDRWGNWITLLAPIKDPVDGELVGVLGLDYDAVEWYANLWKQMIPDFVVSFFIIMFYVSLVYIWIQGFRLSTLNKKLALEEAFYHGVFDQAPIGIAIVNDKNFTAKSEFDYMNTNPMFEEIIGWKGGDLERLKWPDITHPDDLQEDLDKFEEFKKGNIENYMMEKRFIKKDGSFVWTYMKISHLSALESGNSMHLCFLEDISERKESERKNSVLMYHLPGVAYRCKYNKAGTVISVSEGCYSLTGYSQEELIYNSSVAANDTMIPEDRKLLWEERQLAINNRTSYRCEYEIVTATGGKKWILDLGQGIYNDKGEPEAVEGIALDISDRKEIEDHLRYLNEHDGWTGLYNREYLEFLLAKDANNSDILKRAIISINLSTVQLLTPNFGFRYTQRLIKKAAEALKKHCTENRILFRTYENRFVFYLRDYKDKNELIEFSLGIAEGLGALFLTERIGGGIGVLEIDPDDELDTDLMLKKLLIASERKTDIFSLGFDTRFYDEELEKLVSRENEIRENLFIISDADSSGQLFLQYQPILDLKTNSICGFEALARLKTKELGLVSPFEFIPIAEETKLIIPLGYKIILEALRFLKKLEKFGQETISVSINISVVQLMVPNFVKHLIDIIEEVGVKPENVCLEITESVFFFDFDFINNIIGEFKDAGLRVAIDDFGTGYSSLARERDLNIDSLKIDKYFIDYIHEGNLEKSITPNIISMAHKLGHSVTAEGIEHENQLEFLREHGCDKIQGYLISRPLDEDKAFEFLEKNK